MATAEQLHRAAGSVALAVGVASTFAPAPFLRPFGVRPAEVNGAAELGWRMFGIRTALVGGAIVAGHGPARDAMVPVQVADQLVFASIARRGTLPRRATVMAQVVSAGLVALSLSARRAA